MIPIAKPVIDEGTIAAVGECLRLGKLAQGEKVREFEESFARYIDTDYAIAVSNGTTALHIALMAAGIGEGDEVITTPFSFIASANSVLYCNAKPVFVDIDPETYNLDANLIEAKINSKTRAVIGVHLYGRPFDIEKIQDICKRHSLVMIEDACQAHGAEYKGKKVGSFGIGCFSFYPTKNMTTGEGGMITTGDSKIMEKCRLLRSHGQHQRYLHTSLGYNFRMTDVEATIGIEQLKRLDEFNRRRIENAAVLTKAISTIDGLKPPVILDGIKHVYHQYTIRVTDTFPLTRDELKNYLEEKGVGCAIHYPLPINKQPLYKDMGYEDVLPEAEKAANEVISLPVHPSISRDDLKYIIEVLKNAR